MPETSSAATDFDRISDLKAISDARMRQGDRLRALCLLIHHHTVLTEVLRMELQRPPSDASFCCFVHQMDHGCGSTVHCDP